MRRPLLALAIAALLPSVAAAQGAPAERPEVTAAAKAQRDQVVAWRRDFHQFPELSNREQRTAAKVAEHLRALGLFPPLVFTEHGAIMAATILNSARAVDG